MTNNEVRQNILASMEHHKAYIALYQVKAMIEYHLTREEGVCAKNMTTLKTHVNNLVNCVDEYKGIPANDETFIGA